MSCFLLGICSVPNVTKDQYEDAVRACLSRMKEDRSLNYLRSTVDDAGFFFAEELEVDDDKFIDLLVSRAVESVNALSTNRRRDMTILYLDGKTYWVSGGVTMGDDPTEAYAMINFLSTTGLDCV